MSNRHIKSTSSLLTIKKILIVIMPYAGMIIIALLFSVLSNGIFLGSSNIANLVSQGITMVIIATGAAFIYALGSIDISIGAVLGLSSVVSGVLMRQFQIPGWLGILVSIATGIICCSITALLQSTLSVPPFVASIAMMNIYNGIIEWIIEDGDVIISHSQYSKWDSPAVKIAVIIFVLCVGYITFTKTRLGKDAKAIGGNRLTAKISGVRITKTTIICFMILGACVGLAGFFALIRTSRVSAGNSTFALNIITAVVLGGFPLKGGAKAKIQLAVVGAISVVFLTNGLTLIGLDPATSLVVRGILFLLIIGISYERQNIASVK